MFRKHSSLALSIWVSIGYDRFYFIPRPWIHYEVTCVSHCFKSYSYVTQYCKKYSYVTQPVRFAAQLTGFSTTVQVGGIRNMSCQTIRHVSSYKVSPIISKYFRGMPFFQCRKYVSTWAAIQAVSCSLSRFRQIVNLIASVKQRIWISV